MKKPHGERRSRTRALWLYPSWLQKKKTIEGQPWLFLVSGLVGLLGGVSASVFKSLSKLFQTLFIGTEPSFLDAALRLPWYLRIAIPTLGGVLAGFALYLLPKERK